MAIDTFCSRVVAHLNILQPNAGWVGAHQIQNLQPWTRLYKSNWTNHPLSRKLRQANRKGLYPPLWFQIHCSTEKKKKFDGAPPFDIYVPIDERGIYSPNDNFVAFINKPRMYLPQPDLYLQLLLNMSNCYQNDVGGWINNISDVVDLYLIERHYKKGKKGYVLPYFDQSPRTQLDYGRVIVVSETDEEVEACAMFIISREPTLDCAINVR